MTRLLLAAAVLFFTSFCAAAGWTQPMTVTTAFTETDDMIVFSTSDTTVYAPGCAAGAFIFSTSSTDAQRARVWAVLLTALATGQKVAVWYSDTCTTWNYHLTTTVKLYSQSP